MVCNFGDNGGKEKILCTKYNLAHIGGSKRINCVTLIYFCSSEYENNL